MPYLKDIQDEYGDENLEIVAVNIREGEQGESDPDAYIESLGFPLTAIRNGEDIAAAYDVKYTPGLLVVDVEGTVSYRRGMTRLPAGQTIAELWDEKVRAALDAEFMNGC